MTPKSITDTFVCQNSISDYILKIFIWFHKLDVPQRNSMSLILNLFLLFHILIQFKDITFYLAT